MSNIRPFQIVVLAVFALLGIGALIFLGMYQAKVSQEQQVYGDQVIVWGTLDANTITDMFAKVSKDIKAFDVVQYKQFDSDTFENELVNAIAEGRSPDLIMIDSDQLTQLRAKLLAIPYSNISERSFKNTYVDGAEIYALSDGIYGIPFGIDPMVQYWNRDIFSSNGIAQPPQTWEEVVNNIVPKIAVRDTNRNVLRSAVPFGEYANVTDAKDILMMLALQSGSQMVTESNGKYTVALDTPVQQGNRPPLQTTLQFYTDFSNANSPLYTWNRAQPNDKTAFLSGDLALYYGLGSEYQDIADKNPNLNFDVSVVPQGTDATIRRTYGAFYALAIPKASPHKQAAFAVANTLTTQRYAAALAKSLHFASARRDVLSAGDADPVQQVIFNSALIARGWYDPAPQQSDTIFKQMIEDVTSNRLRIKEAVDDAINRLSLAY